MSENDETISGSDLAIMKPRPGEMDQKYFQNSHFVTERDEASSVFQDSPGEFEPTDRSTESLFLMLHFLLDGSNGNFYNK